MVHSKVGHCVAVILWLLRHGWNPLAIDLLLIADVLLRVDHILISSKVGHKVVNGVLVLLVLLLDDPFVRQLILSLANLLSNVLDIVIDTKVGHCVVLWHLVLLDVWQHELVAHSLLGIGQASIGVVNIVVSAEVSDEVVNWVTSLGSSWLPTEQRLSLKVDSGGDSQQSQGHCLFIKHYYY